MQTTAKSAKMLSVEDGWLTCPICRRNRRLKRIDPSEEAERVKLYCRDCKSEFFVTIHRGQCFESRGQ